VLHRTGIILIFLLLNACATYFSQTSKEVQQEACYGPLPNVYSGFIYDLQCFTHYGCDAFGNCNLFYKTNRPEDFYCFLDTPLSFVLDTVLLPATIYKQNKYGNICKIKKYTDDEIAGLSGLTGLRRPSGIVVDTINNQVFVANERNDSLTVYGRTDAGNIAPARTIAGASTGLSKPNGIAVDTLNDQIFVTAYWHNNSITVYRRTDSGNVTPVRTIIYGESTDLNYPRGIAVDTVNDQIFVTGYWNDNSITVYGRTDSGNVTSIRTISGESTGLSNPNGIAVDTVNNHVFVANGGNDSITVYGRTDTGNIAPVRTIAGTSTGLSNPNGIAVDTGNNQVFVANYGNNSITVYGRIDSGNVAPVRTISGANTGLGNPKGIAVDTINNQIFVANYGNNSITVYGRTDTGNIAPVRTISSTSTSNTGTGLSSP
jgi:DNA-binding beta-propeller fold protein YncE